MTALLCMELILALPVVAIAESSASATSRPSARQVVERIKQHVGCPWSAATVDTFKAGDPDTLVSGIVTTHVASFDVLKRAVASGCNFVISHEPIYYNHLDETKSLEGDAVFAQKLAFIKEHGLVVFRFHDHWHARQPDGIIEGMIAKLSWNKYLRADKGLPTFEVPRVGLNQLAMRLKEKLGGSAVRVVGDADARFTKIAMAPGAAGPMTHLKLLEREDVEVLVIGESAEWETVEYVRDALAQGRKKALILLGHCNSEEAGMENCAAWLSGFVREVPVKFLPAGDPMWTAAK